MSATSQEHDDAGRAGGVGQDELVAGLKRALQHPTGDHDGWTDAGMEDAFFRWPVIVNALNEALAAPVPVGESVSAPDRIWLCGFDTDHRDISWSSCPNPTDDPEVDGKQVEYVRLDHVSGQRVTADITTEVPLTVDPDLIEARKMTAATPSDYEHVNDKIRRGHWLNGVYDNDPRIQITLAAIKRGRALATAPSLEAELQAEINRLRGLLIDPGNPAWEDARGVLVAELRKNGMETHADNIALSHAVPIPSWIALNLIAHAATTPARNTSQIGEG